MLNGWHSHENVTEFEKSYIETMLWSSTDNGDTNFDSCEYEDTEFSSEALAQIRKDCSEFIEQSANIIDAVRTGHPVAHDFWLTRNRHGAGFWDGDYPKTIGEELTALSHKFGEQILYVGDDGKFYLFKG